ncbi:hypothetical protein P2H44_25405 [Albimonas sp. CAU 1670]|uniref:hypothetical protein n=1 Tax=Albimonas sp. CAU 1670 TaxID=3032599 RepID=UPI0023DBE362|nr:hypothetical protein [Albimonas sp. CAU 1670]MDF2235901.1 hypothetical protein [Albimonas sp. CAU 1670]
MRPVRLALALTLLAAAAHAGPLDKAKDIVDPDCTVAKAAKNAAMKATIGVGNRCSAAETARDIAGIDGKGDDLKEKREDASDKDGGVVKKLVK